MSLHIQGPWQVGYEFDETGYPLFLLAGLSGDQKRDRPSLEATAKLIAAAPELLDACKGAEEWLAGWASASPYIDILRAALGKATK